MARAAPREARSVGARARESRDFAASAAAVAIQAASALCASARSQGADLAALTSVARSAAGNEAEGVARAVRDLVGQSRQLVARVLQHGDAQHDAVTRGVQAAEVIAGLAREVTGITADARLLAINANIASTRLGHTGMAAAVIATRVQGLAAEIAEETRSLGGLSRELSETLPPIATRSGDLRAQSSAFSDRASALLERIESTQRAVGDRIAAEVALSERRVTEIIDHAAAVEARLREHHPVEALLDRAARSADSGDASDAYAALDRAAEISLATITPASEHLLSLNRVADDQVEALARLADALSERSDAGAIGGASRALGAAVEEFVASSRSTIEQQRRSVEIAVESASRRGRIGESLRRLVLEARMLTLAIRVEVARIGVAGVELLHIAAELDGFTGRLDGFVSSADESLGELGALLLDLGAQSRADSELIEAFARSAPRRGAELDRALEEAADDVRRALQGSEDRARALLDASHALVNHLQFQDRLTQEIRLLQPALSGSSAAVPEKSFLETQSAGGLAAGEMVLF